MFNLTEVTEKNQLETLMSIVNNSKLRHLYKMLKEAANYFFDSNKFGQATILSLKILIKDIRWAQ